MPEPLEQLPRRRPETTAIAAAGGSWSASRSGASTAVTRPGSAWRAASITGWSGWRVCTSRCPCPSSAHHPAGQREQRQRLLRRPVPGAVSSWSKSRKATASAGATRCRTARCRPPAGGGIALLGGAGDLADGLSRERLELLAGAATPTRRLRNRVDRAVRRPPGARCRTAGRPRPPRAARPPRTPRSGPGHRTSRRRAAGPGRSGSRRRSPGPHGAQEVDEPVGEETALRGVVVPPVHHLDRRPAPPLLGPARGEEGSPRRGASSVGHGDTTEARPAAPLGPLAGDVAGVPGGGLLGLVTLVVLVQHHHPAEPGHGRPGIRPGPRSPSPRRRRPGPTPRRPPRRACRGRGRRPGDRIGRGGRPAAGLGNRGAEHERVAVGIGGGRQHEGYRSAPGASRSTPRAAAGRRPGAGRPAARRRVRAEAGPAGPAPPPAAARSGGNGRPAGPAPRRPAGEVDDVGRGPQPVTLASGRRSIPSRGSTSVSTTHAPTRRPCSSARTIVPTRTRSSQPSGTL